MGSMLSNGESGQGGMLGTVNGFQCCFLFLSILRSQQCLLPLDIVRQQYLRLPCFRLPIAFVMSFSFDGIPISTVERRCERFMAQTEIHNVYFYLCRSERQLAAESTQRGAGMSVCPDRDYE